MFMPEISNWMVSVNGKYPWSEALRALEVDTTFFSQGLLLQEQNAFLNNSTSILLTSKLVPSFQKGLKLQISDTKTMKIGCFAL